jgi:hypothetical protein
MLLDFEKRSISLEVKLLLSVQRALWDEIDSNLRAVKINWNDADEIIYLFFYFDKKVTAENTDSASCVAGEVAGDFPPEVQVVESCIHIDFPEEIPFQRLTAFLRKELDKPLLPIEFFPRKDYQPIPYLAYALQQGLLGRVFESLRYAGIDIENGNKILKFYFYYDKEISEEIKNVSEEAIAVAAQAFPSDYKAIGYIKCLPYPSQIPQMGQSSVFRRKKIL